MTSKIKSTQASDAGIESTGFSRAWPVEDAGLSLADIAAHAATDGPQGFVKDGRVVAAVLSRAEFDWLSGRRGSLVDFMRASPMVGLDDVLVFERDGAPI